MCVCVCVCVYVWVWHTIFQSYLSREMWFTAAADCVVCAYESITITPNKENWRTLDAYSGLEI